jgi:DNA-binding LytR/AlgR family response regulator
VKENDIKNCVKKLLDGKSKRSLVFSFNKKKYNIGFDEIVYISSYGHYITIHTEGNGYEWKYSLKELQKELPGQFVRCHRSFIVNLDHMRKIEGKRIQMKNGSVIDVAGGYLESVRKALSKLV